MLSSIVAALLLTSVTPLAALDDRAQAGCRRGSIVNPRRRPIPGTTKRPMARERSRKKKCAFCDVSGGPFLGGLPTLLAWGGVIAIIALVAYLVVRNLEFDRAETPEMLMPGARRAKSTGLRICLSRCAVRRRPALGSPAAIRARQLRRSDGVPIQPLAGDALLCNSFA